MEIVKHRPSCPCLSGNCVAEAVITDVFLVIAVSCIETLYISCEVLILSTSAKTISHDRSYPKLYGGLATEQLQHPTLELSLTTFFIQR